MEQRRYQNLNLHESPPLSPFPYLETYNPIPYHNRRRGGGSNNNSSNAATLRPRLLPMRRLISSQGQRTHPVVWLVATVFAFLAIALIVTGIAVFVVYMIYKPKMPYIEVSSAQLVKLDYDQFGTLDTEMVLTIAAENDNARANVSFSGVGFSLRFHGIRIAELRSGPFRVPKNSSYPLRYDVPSSAIPLDRGAREAMDAALRRDRVPFQLDGQARTRWKVGVLLSVKFWTRLSCKIEFFRTNGSSVGLDCSSRSL